MVKAMTASNLNFAIPDDPHGSFDHLLNFFLPEASVIGAIVKLNDLLINQSYTFCIHLCSLITKNDPVIVLLLLHGKRPLKRKFANDRRRVYFGERIFVLAKIVPCIAVPSRTRSEEHTSELQSRENLVCRLLLEKKKITKKLIATEHTDIYVTHV